MDLSEFFEEDEVVEDKNVFNDIKEEIKTIAEKHNVKCNETFITELTNIFMDSPPWYPWIK